MASPGIDVTEQTRSVLERRMDVVSRMWAGAAGYEDVLEHHADDFVWLSAAGARVGHEAALAHHRRRMEQLPPGALDGARVIALEACGEYGFVLFKTDTMPFGTDSYRVVDGKVVFQSNALYLPQALR